MSSKYWIKLWHEALHDRKMAQLRDRLYRRVIECFLFAGERDDEGFLPEIDDMAWNLHTDPETLETELNELAQLGILQLLEGRWHVTHFAERQAPMAKVEYMRRKRKAEHYQTVDDSLPESYQSVTSGNTDKIRIEEKRVYIEPSPNGEHTPIHSGIAYELPTEAEPFPELHEKRNEMVSAISGVVKTVHALGKTDADFNSIADALIKQDTTVEQVEAFGAWWKDNGHYSGKPALTSFIQEFNNVGATSARKEYGHDAIPASQVAE